MQFSILTDKTMEEWSVHTHDQHHIGVANGAFSLLVSVSHHKNKHLNQASLLSRVFKCDKMAVVSFPSEFAAENKKASISMSVWVASSLG